MNDKKLVLSIYPLPLKNSICFLFHNFHTEFLATIICTLQEDQPLRLLLNLLFYGFNRSEPTHKSQRIRVLDVIAACNQLNVNALN